MAFPKWTIFSICWPCMPYEYDDADLISDRCTQINLCVCLSASLRVLGKIWCYFSLGITTVFKTRQKHSVEHCLQLACFFTQAPEKEEGFFLKFTINSSGYNVHLTYILDQYSKFRLAVQFVFHSLHQFTKQIYFFHRKEKYLLSYSQPSQKKGKNV